MRTSILLVASLVLSGCQNSGTLSACDGWRPIQLTKQDASKISDPLADQILAHNEFGEKIGCWKGK